MSLEGLRAWVAEVERKLGKRTRVFLALAVIAIGIGGAAIYLAIDARNSSVSESDVQALQEELETRIDEVAAGATAPTTPPVEVEPTPAPQPEEPQPKSEGGANGSGSKGGGANGGGGGGSVPEGATGGAANSAEIEKLLEEAQKQNAEAEARAKQRSGATGE